MNHQHFKEISSTQDYLRNFELLEGDILISCDHQTNGVGQYDRAWHQYDGGLCFSFTLDPSEVLSLSSLEISILICKYFKETYKTDLKVKWPNDLFTDKGDKCGGILIHHSSSKKSLIVGIGLNYFQGVINKDFKFKNGSIFPDEFSYHSKDEAFKIYNFILNNRILYKYIPKMWKEFCIHLNKFVKVTDNQTEIEGEFTDIGEHGEAIVQTNNGVKKFYSGSLKF